MFVTGRCQNGNFANDLELGGRRFSVRHIQSGLTSAARPKLSKRTVGASATFRSLRGFNSKGTPSLPYSLATCPRLVAEKPNEPDTSPRRVGFSFASQKFRRAMGHW